MNNDEDLDLFAGLELAEPSARTDRAIGEDARGLVAARGRRARRLTRLSNAATLAAALAIAATLFVSWPAERGSPDGAGAPPNPDSPPRDALTATGSPDLALGLVLADLRVAFESIDSETRDALADAIDSIDSIGSIGSSTDPSLGDRINACLARVAAIESELEFLRETTTPPEAQSSVPPRQSSAITAGHPDPTGPEATDSELNQKEQPQK